MRLTIVRSCAVAAVALAAASSAFGAGPRASVRLLSAPSSVAPGAALTVKVRIGAGTKKTAGGTVDVVISSDRKLDTNDVAVGSARVAALKPHRSRTLTFHSTAPSSLTPGSGYLVACLGKRCSVRGITISGSGGGGDPVTTGDGRFPSSVPANIKGVTPNPRSVAPVTDASHAASGLITGDAGGTVTASAGGVTYRLDVPKAAVLSDITVTLTPLSSVGGIPASGGFAAGVQLSPDGLQLLGSATLTISGASGSSLAAFGYHGAGENLGLLPLLQQSGSLVIPVSHFSGVAVGSATSTDIQGQAAHAPSLSADQFRQQIATDLRSGTAAQLEADAASYYTAVIKPELEAALTDDSLAPAAMADALSLDRMMQLMGANFPYDAEITEYHLRILVNIYNHAYNRCVNNHDPGEVRNMIAVLRRLELVGAGDRVDQGKASRCLTFHLDYQLDAHYQLGTGASINATLDLSSMGTPLAFRWIGAALEADLPPTVNSWTFYDYLCNKTGGTATVTQPAHAVLTFNLNPQKGANGVVTFGTPTFRLLFSPGQLTLLNACGLDGFARPIFPGIWSKAYKDLPRDASGTLLVEGPEWTYQGGEVYATVDDSRTITTGETWQTRLRFTLHHDPQPAS